MEEHTDAYVEFVSELLEKAKQNCKDPLVQVEQRLDLSAVEDFLPALSDAEPLTGTNAKAG